MTLTQEDIAEDTLAIQKELVKNPVQSLHALAINTDLQRKRKLSQPALRRHIIAVATALGWEFVRIRIDGRPIFAFRPAAVAA